MSVIGKKILLELVEVGEEVNCCNTCVFNGCNNCPSDESNLLYCYDFDGDNLVWRVSYTLSESHNPPEGVG